MGSSNSPNDCALGRAVAVVGAGIAWAVLKDNSPEMAPTNPTIFFLFIGISCFGLTAPKRRPWSK
jgi:hypothetical protein